MVGIKRFIIMTNSAQTLFAEREKRVNDAIACKVPDRVPLLPLFGGFSSSYAGISRAEELYDPFKCFDAVLKTTLDFEPDMAESLIESIQNELVTVPETILRRFVDRYRRK